MENNLFRCHIDNNTICLKCDSCRIKVLILENEIDKIDDVLCQKFLRYRYLDKRPYKHIMEEFGIKKLYEIKSKIRLGVFKINMNIGHVLNDEIKKYKREENLKNILT